MKPVKTMSNDDLLFHYRDLIAWKRAVEAINVKPNFAAGRRRAQHQRNTLLSRINTVEAVAAKRGVTLS